MDSPEDTYASVPARSAYHDRLPIGTSLSAAPLLESPLFGFEGDVRMRPLEPILVPERPRQGERDAADCFHCTVGQDEAICPPATMCGMLVIHRVWDCHSSPVWRRTPTYGWTS